jgi:hypothetical protein
MEKLIRQQTFSVRDRKRLNKQLRQQLKLHTIDYTEIIPEFPGKSIEILRATVSQLMKKKKVNGHITIINPINEC